MDQQRTQLEQAIDDAPDDASRYAVLGDWCLQAGDPRGELISIQLARAGTARERELLLADGIRISQTLQAKWRWGFVHELHFVLMQHPHWEERRDDWTSTLLAPALAHPSCRFLRELVIDAGPGDEVLRFLSAHVPRVLTALSLTCNEVDLANLRVWQLTRLDLSAQLIIPAKISGLAALEELSLPADALSVDGLATVIGSVSGIQKLTLSSLERFDARAMFPVLLCRKLEHLTLRAEETTIDAMEALVDSHLRETLRVLDVSRSGMNEDAAHLLLESVPKFAQLDSLLLGDAV